MSVHTDAISLWFQCHKNWGPPHPLRRMHGDPALPKVIVKDPESSSVEVHIVLSLLATQSVTKILI